MAHLKYLIGLGGILGGLAIGYMTGVNPLYVAVALFVPAFLMFFFKNFELTVVGLLVLRSALDPFSEQGITGLFATGLSGLTILYVVVRLLRKQPVHVDGFWWFFLGWVVVQGLWVVLLPLGGLDLGSDRLPEASREWTRLFCWAMSYLLTLQLKERMRPEQFVNCLLLALIIPLATACLQFVVPGNLLPSFLAVSTKQDGFRINGTLGVANTFVTFLILFASLTYWKITTVPKRLPWFLLMGLIIFFLVNTKVLVGLIMLAVMMVAMVAPRLSLPNLLGSIVVIALMFGLFASTDFGSARLASISQTPLLNPDIDVSRAIVLAAADGNSFNWRIAQWSSLIGHWKQSPILGYGLQTANYFRPMFAWAHNDYVRALVEEGIVGLSLFFLFLGVQLVRLIRIIQTPFLDKNQRTFCLTLIAFWLATMVGMLTENVWSHTALFFYWFSLSAVADWEWGQDRVQSEPIAETRLAHFQ
jgi:O-antigen ligase